MEISLAISSEMLKMNEQASGLISAHLGKCILYCCSMETELQFPEPLTTAVTFHPKILKGSEKRNGMFFKCFLLRFLMTVLSYRLIKTIVTSRISFLLTDCSHDSDLQKHFDSTTGASSCLFYIQC